MMLLALVYFCIGFGCMLGTAAEEKVFSKDPFTIVDAILIVLVWPLVFVSLLQDN